MLKLWIYYTFIDRSVWLRGELDWAKLKLYSKCEWKYKTNSPSALVRSAILVMFIFICFFSFINIYTNSIIIYFLSIYLLRFTSAILNKFKTNQTCWYYNFVQLQLLLFSVWMTWKISVKETKHVMKLHTLLQWICVPYHKKYAFLTWDYIFF